MRRVAIVPVGVCDGGGNHQQDGGHHAYLLVIFEVEQVDAHRYGDGDVCKLAPTALAGQRLAFAQYSEVEKVVRNEAGEQEGTSDSEEFLRVFLQDEFADEDARHDAKLQESVDEVEPKPIVGFFDFLGAELEQVDPAHDKCDTDEGCGCLGHAHPYEHNHAHKNDCSENAPYPTAEPYARCLIRHLFASRSCLACSRTVSDSPPSMRTSS